MLKLVEFGPEVITYIRSCLSEGDTISRYLLVQSLEGGRVTTQLPDDVDSEASQRFEVGGITKRSDTESYLVAFISAYLNQLGKRYVVFETLARLGDASLASSKNRFFTYRTEIYYFLTSKDCDPEKIINAIRKARSYPFIGVLTSTLEDEPDIQTGHVLAPDVLEKFATRAEHILIGAYDSEGVLIWSKT
jgi:hypothetical protein